MSWLLNLILLIKLQSSFLDVTIVPTYEGEGLGDLLDDIFSPDQPLPYPRVLTNFTNWDDMIRFFFYRIQEAIAIIRSHPTDRSGSRMRLTGGMGAFGILRQLEFLRRCTHSMAASGKKRSRGMEDVEIKVERLIRQAEWCLRCEMWRRWASGSFHESRNEHGGELRVLWLIFMEACFTKQSDSLDVSRTINSSSWRWLRCHNGSHVNGPNLTLSPWSNPYTNKPCFKLDRRIGITWWLGNKMICGHGSMLRWEWKNGLRRWMELASGEGVWSMLSSGRTQYTCQQDLGSWERLSGSPRRYGILRHGWKVRCEYFDTH